MNPCPLTLGSPAMVSGPRRASLAFGRLSLLAVVCFACLSLWTCQRVQAARSGPAAPQQAGLISKQEMDTLRKAVDERADRMESTAPENQADRATRLGPSEQVKRHLYHIMNGDLKESFQSLATVLAYAPDEFVRNQRTKELTPIYQKKLVAAADSLRRCVFSEVYLIRVKEYDFNSSGYCIGLEHLSDYPEFDGLVNVMWAGREDVPVGYRALALHGIRVDCQVPGTNSRGFFFSLPEAEAQQYDLFGASAHGVLAVEIFYRPTGAAVLGNEYTPSPPHAVVGDVLAFRILSGPRIDPRQLSSITPLFYRGPLSALRPRAMTEQATSAMPGSGATAKKAPASTPRPSQAPAIKTAAVDSSGGQDVAAKDSSRALPAAKIGVDDLVGSWEVVYPDGNRSSFDLSGDGGAVKNPGDVTGKWFLFDGDALITWKDGWSDRIHPGKTPVNWAYAPGASLEKTPTAKGKAVRRTK